MKKLAIIAGIGLLPILGLSQVSDIIKDGYRLVSMPAENVRNFTDRVVFYAGLGAGTYDIEKQIGIDTIHYFLSLQASTLHDYEIPKNGKLLLRLFDGTVIELRNQDIITSYANIEFIGSVMQYRAVGMYEISEVQLMSVINKGITKLRMETNTTPIDNEWKKDKIGKVLGNQYPQIKAAISQPKSFDSDF